MLWYCAIAGTAFGVLLLAFLNSIIREVRGLRGQGHDVAMKLIALDVYFKQINQEKREEKGELGWAMACVGCGAEMPVSRIHAKMVWDLAMKTKSWPTPRCPTCAESFTWKREG